MQPPRQAAKGSDGSVFDIYSRPPPQSFGSILIKTKMAAKEETLFFQAAVL